MATQPNFQGVFSQAEGRLGKSVVESKQQANRDANQASFQKAQTALQNRRLSLEQAQFEHGKTQDAIAEARQKKLDPLQLQRAEQVLKEGDARIAQLKSSTKIAFDQFNLKRAEFIGEKLANVTTQEQVDEMDTLFKSLGVLAPDQKIGTVGRAQLMYEGSQHQKLSHKLQQDAKLSNNAEENKFRLAREKNKLEGQLLERRSQLGINDHIQNTLIDFKKEKALNEQKKNLGLGGGINIINQGSPLEAEAKAAGIPARAQGGPVNAGQPYLVGEQGPELVVPDQNANVVPNHQLGAPQQQLVQNSHQDAMMRLQQDNQRLNQQADEIFSVGGGAQSQEDPASRMFPDLSREEEQTLRKSQLTKGKIPVKNEDGTISFQHVPGTEPRLSHEEKAKRQMIFTAIDASKNLDKYLFDKNGEVDRVNLMNAHLMTYGSEGREFAQNMEFGIQAITRGETGAAMADTEIASTRKRFMPSVGDSKYMIKQKIRLYRDFLNGVVNLTVPIKGQKNKLKLDEVAFKGELRNRLKADFIERFIKTNAHRNATKEHAEKYIRLNKIDFTVD